MAHRLRFRRAAGQATSSQIGFGSQAYERLARRVGAAQVKARSRGRAVIAGVTVPVAAGIDPLLRVTGMLDGSERWSYFEQPARGGHAIAAFGEAALASASGPDRFADIARDCATLLGAAEVDDLADDPGAPPGAGPVWMGGFAFFDDGPFGDSWRDMPAALFMLPSASLARAGDQARLTLNLAVGPDDDAARLLAGAESLVDRLRLDDLEDRPPGDRPSAGSAVVSSSASPEHYEQSVERASVMIERGELKKVVLARQVVLRRERPIDPVRALYMLRDRFPECTTFALGDKAKVFLGATPELLIRREGRRASTLALAGSMRRGIDEQTDRHLGEQLLASAKNNREHEFVVRRIERTLGRLSAWTAAGERPELVKVKNIQHLATPIRAQLTEPRPVVELAGLLHPTPAVGGEPWPAAGDAIKSLEALDRGWYTGGVGWMDQLEDGEFHVALRSALVEGAQALMFAGAGIVADSDPAAELAETETKLEALLPVLSSC